MASKKRYRRIDAKPGELIARYGRDDCGNIDLIYAHGGEGAGRPDARVLSEALEGCDVFQGNSLRQELEARGYDIETLRFSIRHKQPSATQPPDR